LEGSNRGEDQGISGHSLKEEKKGPGESWRKGLD